MAGCKLYLVLGLIFFTSVMETLLKSYKRKIHSLSGHYTCVEGFLVTANVIE